MPERSADDAHDRPWVREELDARSLHFSASAIQSRMQILQPDALALEYTRTMMVFLMFRPQPAQIAMIGLGGGSLAKFCHRHLPWAALTVVEVNPHVIALRDAFQVPPDSARFQVIEADGAAFVETTAHRFDVLLVDAFDAQGLPAALGTQRFYDDCLDVLRPGGVLAVNLHAQHPDVPVWLARIRRSFGADILRVDDRDASNSVVFACKGGLTACAGASARRRPATLAPEPWAQLRGEFARVAAALQRLSS